ncbi:MAG: serine dehydratase beta chain, partial [Myxococcota bacterium]
MALSAFDIFTIGIGPSSSHAVGPMRAAGRFLRSLERAGVVERTARVRVELFGSLGATGKGHGSDLAILMGLEGEAPETVDTDTVAARAEAIHETGSLSLGGRHAVKFRYRSSLVFNRRKTLPGHPNGMRFTAYDPDGHEVLSRIYYSVGGGFVVDDGAVERDTLTVDQAELPHRFSTGEQLLRLAEQTGKSISRLQLENECVWRPEADVRKSLGHLWATMKACIDRGCAREGVLPGGLRVQRRAHALYRKLKTTGAPGNDALAALDWVNLWALAVN